MAPIDGHSYESLHPALTTRFDLIQQFPVRLLPGPVELGQQFIYIGCNAAHAVSFSTIR
jgi:hypothetical protein